MTFNKNHPYDDLPKLPPTSDLRAERFSSALVKARAELAELKGYLHSIPTNPMLIISPSILRESIASSEIEDIHTTLVDVLQTQLLSDEIKGSGADKEVLRYRDALVWGFEKMNETSISTRLILGVHKKLMPHLPEEYRKDQNYIVDRALGEKLYTPPSPTEISRLMYNWENFVNNSVDHLDPLIKCAIAHYQFEAIHPFADGNGRTGRILIVLQLIKEGLLPLPTLFISGYLIKHRSDYYKHLREITYSGEWGGYISFMLDAFYHQAFETKRVLLSAKYAYDSFKKILKIEHSSIYSADLVNSLFSFPVINPNKLAKELGTHRVTASKYLKAMTKAGLLREYKSGTYHLYLNFRLMDAMQNK
ncbi:MAG: Fic family protein [Candidatus Taylorbacteria bacterium]